MRLLHTFSAVDEDALSGDIPSRVGAEQADDAGTVLGLAIVADGDTVCHLLGISRVGKRLYVAVGVDDTGGNIVDGDAEGGKLEREGYTLVRR